MQYLPWCHLKLTFGAGDVVWVWDMFKQIFIWVDLEQNTICPRLAAVEKNSKRELVFLKMCSFNHTILWGGLKVRNFRLSLNKRVLIHLEDEIFFSPSLREELGVKVTTLCEMPGELWGFLSLSPPTRRYTFLGTDGVRWHFCDRISFSYSYRASP